MLIRIDFLIKKYLHRNRDEHSISINDLQGDESNPETKINQELLKDHNVKFIYEVNKLKPMVKRNHLKFITFLLGL